MKKNFLRITAITLSMGMLTACGSTAASSGSSTATASAETSNASLTLKVGLTAPTGSFQDEVLQALEENLQTTSGGTITLDIAAGGVLGNTASHYSQMAQGTLDLFCTGFDTTSALKDASDFNIVTVPFLFDDLDHYKKFLESDVLQQMVSKVETSNGIHYAGVISDQAPRALTTTNKPVYTVDDVNNLKLRCPESPALVEVWKAMGANPMIVSGGELFTALQSGQVDGQDNDLINSYTSSFAEVQDYFMPLDYVYSNLILWMSQDTYDKMTEEQRTAFDEAVAQTYTQMSDRVWNELYPESEAAFKEGGVTFIDVDKSGFQAVAEQYAKENDGTMWSEGLYQQIRDLA